MERHTWSAEDDAFLRDKWGRAGLTARWVAANMPTGPMTRNAVIGRAWRLGLSKRRYTAPKQPLALPNLCKQPAYTACVWPVGPALAPCGHTVTGGPWCDRHRAIVFVSARASHD